MKLRERIVSFIGSISAWSTLRSSNLYPEIPENGATVQSGGSADQGIPSDRLGRADVQTQSHWIDPAGGDGNWIDRTYFIGSEQMYNLVRRALNSQGLGY